MPMSQALRVNRHCNVCWVIGSLAIDMTGFKVLTCDSGYQRNRHPKAVVCDWDFETLSEIPILHKKLLIFIFKEHASIKIG